MTYDHLHADFYLCMCVCVTFHVNSGLVAAALVFLVFCLLYLHDGPFVRPHPAVWRVVTGCGILYLCSLIYLLFQVLPPPQTYVALNVCAFSVSWWCCYLFAFLNSILPPP